MSRKIYLFVSDVASFIGQNKWDYITPFERLWKKCDNESYTRVIEHYHSNILNCHKQLDSISLQKNYLKSDLESKKITKRQYTKQLNELLKTESIITTNLQSTEKFVDDIDLTQKEKLQKHLGKDNIKTLESDTTTTKDKKQLVQNVVNNLNIDDSSKKQTLKAAESFINKTHGTLKEESAIQMFEKKFGVSLDTSQQFNSKKLCNSKFEWYVCGKCDGLLITQNSENNYIVEVKNRTKSFFNTLRDYENTQIQLYMWMLNINHTKLVEKLDSKIRVTTIHKNDEYISNILHYLTVFTDRFENKFLCSFEKQLEYVSQSEPDKKVFLQKLYLNDIHKLELQKLKNEVNSDNENCMISDTI